MRCTIGGDNSTARALLLFMPGEYDGSDAILQGAKLCGFEHVALVHGTEEATRAIAAHPTIAMFPFHDEKSTGVHIERALRAANRAVPLVGYGPSTHKRSALVSAGLAAYLEEPLSAEQVAGELNSLCTLVDALGVAVRAAVGVRDLKDIQRFVRFTMCQEALARVRGSRRGAARLLGVDRRAVQKLVEQMEDTGTG